MNISWDGGIKTRKRSESFYALPCRELEGMNGVYFQIMSLIQVTLEKKDVRVGVFILHCVNQIIAELSLENFERKFCSIKDISEKTCHFFLSSYLQNGISCILKYPLFHHPFMVARRMP